MKWDNLSLSQKSNLMREYIRNGVTSLDEIRSHYNAYGEGGLMQSDGNPKMTFKQWIEKMHEKYPWLELNSTMAGYDYERYFNENYDDAISRLYEDEPSHFTDRYKLPNHPTFSNESMYSIPYTPSPLDPSTVNYGGRWTDNIFETPNPRQTMMDRLQKIAKGERPESMFIPSETNKQQYPYIYTDNRPYNEYEIYDAYRNELNKQRADISVMVANNSDYGRDRKINEDNLRRLDDYLIRLGLPKIQRQAVLFSVQQENGGETGPHGNGAYGLIGWRGSRKDPIIDQELSTDGNIVLKGLEDQAQYLYNTLTEFDSDSWGGGGIYKDGIEAQKAFMNATDLEEAARALNFGYVRSDEADNLYRTQNTKNIWTPKQIDIENTAPRFDLGGAVPPWFGKTSKDMFADAFRKYQEENPIYTGKPLQPVEVTADRLPNAGVTDDNVRRYTDAVNNGLLNLTQIPNTNLQRAVKVRQFQDDWRDTMGEVSPKVIGTLAASTLGPMFLAEAAPGIILGTKAAMPYVTKAIQPIINGAKTVLPWIQKGMNWYWNPAKNLAGAFSVGSDVFKYANIADKLWHFHNYKNAINNLLSDNGVRKTYNLYKSGDLKGGTKSLFWDALDASMVLGAGKSFVKTAQEINNLAQANNMIPKGALGVTLNPLGNLNLELNPFKKIRKYSKIYKDEMDYVTNVLGESKKGWRLKLSLGARPKLYSELADAAAKESSTNLFKQERLYDIVSDNLPDLSEIAKLEEVTSLPPSLLNKEVITNVTMPNGDVVPIKTIYKTAGGGRRMYKLTPHRADRYGDRQKAMQAVESVIEKPTGEEWMNGKRKANLPIIDFNGNGIEVPVSNDPASVDIFKKYIDDLYNLGAIPVGSTRMIADGYYGGVPGDTEIQILENEYDYFKKILDFQFKRNTKGGTGVTGTSSKVGSFNEGNKLDMNLLKENGAIIHQAESARNPEKMAEMYDDLARKQAKNNLTGRSSGWEIAGDLKIPKEDGSGFYTAEEYQQMLKNNKDLVEQILVDNTLKRNDDKTLPRQLVLLNSVDSKIVNKVTKGIDNMYKQIPKFEKFTERYPSQKFDNVEANKKILEKIGFRCIDIDELASNEQAMKNIVDYWYLQTEATRSANYDISSVSKPLTFEQTLNPQREINNGRASGGGGNTIERGKFGGFTRDYTAYIVSHPLVDKATATFDDVFNAFEREKTIWKDAGAIRDAFRKALNDSGLVGIIDPASIQTDRALFTDDVKKLVNNGKITQEQAAELIGRTAENLGVTGFRGEDYGSTSYLGRYFGTLQSENAFPNQKAEILTHYRNIDLQSKTQNITHHNQPVAAAEFGNQKVFSNNGNNTDLLNRQYSTLSYDEFYNLTRSYKRPQKSDPDYYGSYEDLLKVYDGERHITPEAAKRIINDMKTNNPLYSEIERINDEFSKIMNWHYSGNLSDDDAVLELSDIANKLSKYVGYSKQFSGNNVYGYKWWIEDAIKKLTRDMIENEVIKNHSKYQRVRDVVKNKNNKAYDNADLLSDIFEGVGVGALVASPIITSALIARRYLDKKHNIENNKTKESNRYKYDYYDDNENVDHKFGGYLNPLIINNKIKSRGKIPNDMILLY